MDRRTIIFGIVALVGLVILYLVLTRFRFNDNKPMFNDNKPKVKILDVELGLGINDIDTYRESYTLQEKEDKIFLKIKWLNVANTSLCKQIIIKRYVKPPGSSDEPQLVSSTTINNTGETLTKYFSESTTPKSYTLGWDELTTKVSVIGTNYINFEYIVEDSSIYTILQYNSNTNPPIIEQGDVDISMDELGEGITKSFKPSIPSIDIQPEIIRTPYNIQCMRFRSKSITHNLPILENNLDKMFFTPHPSGNGFTIQFEQSDGVRYLTDTGVSVDIKDSSALVLVNAEKYTNGFLTRLGVLNTDNSLKGYLCITDGSSLETSTIEVIMDIDTKNKVQSSYYLISSMGHFPWCGKLTTYEKYLNYKRHDVINTELTDVTEKLYSSSAPNNIGVAKKIFDNNYSDIRLNDMSYFIFGKSNTDYKWNIYVNRKDLIKAFFDKVYVQLDGNQCNSSLAPFTTHSKGITSGTGSAANSMNVMNVNVFNMDIDFKVGVDWSVDDKAKYDTIIDGIANPIKSKSVEFVDYPSHYYRCEGWNYAFPNGSCINKTGTAATKNSHKTDSAALCEEDCKNVEQCVGYSWKDNNCILAAQVSTKLPAAVYEVRRSDSAFDKSFISKVKKVAGAYIYNIRN